jgi:phosphate transport system permease protein
MNYDVFSHPQSALPLVVWTNVRTSENVLHTLAFEAAFVLLMLVLVLFVAARVLGRTKSGARRRGGAGSGRLFHRSRVPVPIDLPTLGGD